MKKENLEVLLQEINSKFDLVVEEYVALDRKIEVKFDELNEKIEHHSFMIDTLNKKIDAVDARLSKEAKKKEAQR